ncbi:MAG: histidine kinase [Gammaproteobacteria bacterium]|nr:histidine kinase [Gammaproteobacteria bacterium]MCY4337259.1 histidine kinase [Gammaproteobacteria bacterium]
MSLRVRLALLITLLFVAVLGAGSVYAITSARKTITEEIRSAALLTSNMLAASIAAIQDAGDLGLYDELLSELERLETTRHLQIIISLEPGAGSAQPLQTSLPLDTEAPRWFVNLVKPPLMEFKRVTTNLGSSGTEILIRADPADEIDEAWQETRNFLLLLVLFTALANLLVYFILGRDLRPIEAILSGLERIEIGDYRLRLPRFTSVEFTRISERFNHLADVLLQNREENRRLTRRSLEIQEEERRRLAQELHDELGQSLSAIKAIATSMEQTPAHTGQTVAESATVIKTIADNMYGVARGMIRELRPAALDELGLAPALQQLADDWNSAHADTFCHLDIRGDCAQAAAVVNINIYRIVQESLTNVARHAEAKNVQVLLQARDDDTLALEIRDDGAGFDPSRTRAGMGLTGIRERIDSMNGELQLDTAVNKGVSLSIVLPATPE